MRNGSAWFLAVVLFFVAGCESPVQPVVVNYTVSFDSQGGTAVASQTIPNGGLVTTPTAPTRSGYTFGGWFKEAGAVNPWTFASDSVTGNRTLYAKWTAVVVNPSRIKIGSFNAQILGPTKVGRPNTLAVLAGVATQFDLLAIQEVGSNNSTALENTCVTVMNTFVAEMNLIAGANTYGYYRGNQYAYVYKKAVVDVLETHLYVGAMTFTYQPLVGNFRLKTGNFDFSLVTIHTSPGVAVTEVPSLHTVVNEVSAFYSEPDVIVVGDLNADGDYYSEGSGSDLAGFPSTTYITGIPNSADTTVAASSNTYDRLEMTKSLTGDFSGGWGVIRFSDLYDVSICEGPASTAGTEAALSDHYPVWCEFYTNQDTD